MIVFLTRRLVLLVFVLFGLSVLTFSLVNLVPADPARAALGFDATPAMVAQYRHEMGLDKPLPIRYLRYVRNLLRGDLGTSIMTRRPVLDDLEAALSATLELTLSCFLVSVIVGGTLGVIAAVRRGGVVDSLSMSVPLVQLSVPIFVMGLVLLLVFYRDLGWLPYGGRIDSGLATPAAVTGLYTIDSLLHFDWTAFRSSILHLILPAVALSNLALAEMARVTRSAFIDVLGHDYIRTARSKGLPRWRILWRHGARNAAISIVTVMGLRLGFLLAGAVITETIFSWPGIGRYAWQAAQNLDLNAVMGVTLLIGLLYAIINFLVDLSYSLLDPRVRVS